MVYTASRRSLTPPRLAGLVVDGHLCVTCSYGLAAERSGHDDEHGNMCPSSTRMWSKSNLTSGLVQVCSIQLVPAKLARLVQLDRPVNVPDGRGERRVARLLQMQLPTLRPNKQEMRTNGPCLDVHGAVHSPTLAGAPHCTEGGGPKH